LPSLLEPSRERQAKDRKQALLGRQPKHSMFSFLLLLFLSEFVCVKLLYFAIVMLGIHGGNSFIVM